MTTDPIVYLPFINARRGYSLPPLLPSTKVGCAVSGCNNSFAIKDGVAFEATHNGDAIVGLFCSFKCLLEAMPLRCCGHA